MGTPLGVDFVVNNTVVSYFREYRLSGFRPFVNTHCKTPVLSVTGSDNSGLDNLWLAVGFPHCICYCAGHCQLSQALSLIKWVCVYDFCNVTAAPYIVKYILCFQKLFVFCWKYTHALRLALFCDFTQRGMVIPYRRCGTTYRSYLLGTAWPVKVGPTGHPEPSVRNFHSTLPKSEKSADFIYSWAGSCLLCFFESLTVLLLVFCVLLELNERFNIENVW